MKLPCALLSLALCWAMGGAVRAAESEYCSKPLRVAMFEFGVLYNSATGDGIDSRLLDAISKRTGCSIERVLMPRARIWAELKGGTLDLATAAIPTPERQSFGYLLPYLVSRNLVLIRKTSAQRLTSLADLEHSTVQMAAVRGFKHEPAYDDVLAKLAAQGRVKEAADVAELFKFFERGMVDAFFSQPIVFRQYLGNAVDKELLIRDWAPLDQQSVGSLILARKSFTPQQAKNWDRLLSSMLTDGTLLKIYREFVSSREARELVYSGPRNPE